MAVLQDQQFELEGVVFGVDSPIEVEEFTPSRAQIRVKDTDNDAADGARPGRDLRGAASWSWTLYTNQESSATALAALADLEAVWPTEELRMQPGDLTELRYALAGRTRVVYGRPRRFDPVITTKLLSGNVGVASDFAVFDHRYYEDEWQARNMSLATAASGGGVVTPFVPPFTSQPPSEPTVTTIIVGGTVPTPAVITFSGPVSNPGLQVGSLWRAELADVIQAGDPVTVDSRPGWQVATRQSGSQATLNARETNVAELWLPPGEHTLTFFGTDLTGTATCTVKWREAHSSL